jgi:hypothetical protein
MGFTQVQREVRHLATNKSANSANGTIAGSAVVGA